MTVGVEKTAQHRGFNLYGGCEPLTGTLLGNVTQWKPTGCIAFKHSNGVISGLTRFRFPMKCDDEHVAKCFGLEIARLLLDASFSEFERARREKRDTGCCGKIGDGEDLLSLKKFLPVFWNRWRC